MPFTKNILSTVKFLFFGLILMSQSSCAPVNLLNGLTSSKGYQLRKNINYGPLDKHKLDIYEPEAGQKNAPIILYIHGGGWSAGSKDIYKFLGQAFSEAGYTFIVPNYRIYPEVKFPDFIPDIALASDWVDENYQGPIVAMGHSAGAHIVSLIMLDPSYLEAKNLKACELFTGWVGLAGPYDFHIIEEPYLSIFDPDIRRTNAQPINFAKNSTLPSLILTGAEDKKVSPQQSKNMAIALRQAGTPSELRVYDDVDHQAIVARLSKFLRRDGEIFDDIIDFIETLPDKATCL